MLADEMESTVRSMREQGTMQALAGRASQVGTQVALIVTDTVGGALGSTSGPNASATISAHSGMSSNYADIIAGKTVAANSAKGDRDREAPGVRCGGQSSGADAYGRHDTTSTARHDNASAGGNATRAPSAEAVATAQTLASAPKAPPLPAETIAAFFKEFRSGDAANAKCFDCGRKSTEWASISFSILICISCSGRHRQMGTHISRIRSCNMDIWTERQLQIFRHGGNARFAEFLEANGVVRSSDFQCYHTQAAEWYREAWIKNRTLERPVPPPPAGIVVGPCGVAARRTPVSGPADLLDLGTQPAAGDLLDFGMDAAPVAPAPTKPSSAPTVDLLDFAGDIATGPGSGPMLPQASNPQDADFFSFGMTSSGGPTAGVGVGSTAASLLPFDALGGNCLGSSHLGGSGCGSGACSGGSGVGGGGADWSALMMSGGKAPEGRAASSIDAQSVVAAAFGATSLPAGGFGTGMQQQVEPGLGATTAATFATEDACSVFSLSGTQHMNAFSDATQHFGMAPLVQQQGALPMPAFNATNAALPSATAMPGAMNGPPMYMHDQSRHNNLPMASGPAAAVPEANKAQPPAKVESGDAEAFAMALQKWGM
eukprot:NODE_3255_length_2065_cov_8.102167.p1 GENE.NODE_3255_length_2065_cov_8.102167~~NODE_3255_length_2065_cov_8.102167.p1  ORF type:complete len:602 (-),score=95.38 NODE_3255_length_2065_cov_8.102167:190-1995(-)